jgi:hypothetical protein
MLLSSSIFFGLILLLTFLREFKVGDDFLSRFPTLRHFVPAWSFFAPTPGMHDYTIMYRRSNYNDEVEDWITEFTPSEKRSRGCFLWNPEKRFAKALLDIIQDLMNISNTTKNEKQILLSVPYLQILNYISAQAKSESAKKIQFMILTSSRISDYKVIFTSEFHPLV